MPTNCILPDGTRLQADPWQGLGQPCETNSGVAMKLGRKILFRLLVVLLVFRPLPGEQAEAGRGGPTSFSALAASSVDRTWVTPIGVAGHHRTLGITYSGNLGDLPLSQFQTFHPLPASKRPWVSGVQGVFYDAVGLAVGEPSNFWGTHGGLRQSLKSGHLPVVISQSTDGDFKIEQTAFAALPGGETVSRVGDEPLLAYVRVAVTNTSAASKQPVIWVWRSGPSRTYGEIGGRTRTFEPVRLSDTRIVGESGNCHLLFFAGNWKLSFDDSADTSELRYFGRLSTWLQPGETRTFDFVYPYWPLTLALADRVRESSFDGTLAAVMGGWEGLLSTGMRVSVPDVKIGQAFDVALINTLLLSRRVPWGLMTFDSLSFFTRETEPVDMNGTIRLGHYNLVYDDSAQKTVVHTFLETGHAEFARDLLESIFHAQGQAQPRGAFGQEGCLSAGNATAVGERGCSSLWMSGTGYSLWAASQYYKYTHDGEWIGKHEKNLISALQWIRNERHRPDSRKGYEGLIRGRGVCDASYATYHPFNDIVSYWGMKDIATVLSSLGLGGEEWVNEWKDYEQTIKRVYEADDLRAYQGFGGADYGLTAGAAVASGLYALDSPILKRIATGSRTAGWYVMYVARFLAEQGERQKFLNVYYGRMVNHMSHGTLANGEWPVSRDADDKNRSVINVQPHDHSDAAFHYMTRTMLIYEDDKYLHLLAGIPSWWLDQTEQPIEVKQAPTTEGLVSLSVRRTRDNIEARISLGRRARTKSIQLHLPVRPDTRLAEVQVDGKPWTGVERLRNVVSLSGLSGDVRVLVKVR